MFSFQQLSVICVDEITELKGTFNYFLIADSPFGWLVNDLSIERIICTHGKHPEWQASLIIWFSSIFVKIILNHEDRNEISISP